MMDTDTLQKLLNVCLIDGRNRDKLRLLQDYFSEFALFKYRVKIETEYLIFLGTETKLFKKLSLKEIKILRSFHDGFTPENAVEIKKIELEINHDVKAVEYYLAACLKKKNLDHLIPFIHIGLTSYDINIPAYGLILLTFKNNIIIPALNRLTEKLKNLIIKTEDFVMLGRTHGQPALPTTMGKELAVFYSRLRKEIYALENLGIEGKLTGAVGNLNALAFVCPEYDWLNLSSKFIKQLGLVPNLVTTQILPYDNWLVYFDCLRRINSILLNLSQDIWWYISLEYFSQKRIEGEVGSSTMAQKINPITFENAEGNIQIANSLLEFFSRKLPVTRLQRDLSDSTVKRDFGLAFGFIILAWDSLLAGFGRINPEKEVMKKDLENHWEIFAEGVQTFLRIKGETNAFELMKKATRGKTFDKISFHKLIDTLPITMNDKKKLKIKDLSQYTGLASKIILKAITK